ncbi:MAG: hypothetical protein HY318_19870 [Armatimonadetes bacterium]|nr:hypothetical protein [Armatimonadota bacterium]
MTRFRWFKSVEKTRKMLWLLIAGAIVGWAGLRLMPSPYGKPRCVFGVSRYTYRPRLAETDDGVKLICRSQVTGKALKRTGGLVGYEWATGVSYARYNSASRKFSGQRLLGGLLGFPDGSLGVVPVKGENLWFCFVQLHQGIRKLKSCTWDATRKTTGMMDEGPDSHDMSRPVYSGLNRGKDMPHFAKVRDYTGVLMYPGAEFYEVRAYPAKPSEWFVVGGGGTNSSKVFITKTEDSGRTWNPDPLRNLEMKGISPCMAPRSTGGYVVVCIQRSVPKASDEHWPSEAEDEGTTFEFPKSRGWYLERRNLNHLSILRSGKDVGFGKQQTVILPGYAALGCDLYWGKDGLLWLIFSGIKLKPGQTIPVERQLGATEVFLTLSRDEGVTWEEPYAVTKHRGHKSEPTVVVTDKLVIVAYTLEHITNVRHRIECDRDREVWALTLRRNCLPFGVE